MKTKQFYKYIKSKFITKDSLDIHNYPVFQYLGLYFLTALFYQVLLILCSIIPS